MVRNRRTWLIVLLAIAAAAVIALNSGNPWATYKNNLLSRTHGDYLKARQVWDAHPIAHYHLNIIWVAPYYETGGPGCAQEVEVKDEQVVETVGDTCPPGGMYKPMAPDWKAPDPPFERTITGFFTLIDRDSQHVYWTSQGVGCSFIWLESTYDPQFSYPIQMVYELQTPVDAGLPSFPIPLIYLDPEEAARALDPTGCLTIGVFGGPTITVNLTPLP